jgi:hypothetical protein
MPPPSPVASGPSRLARIRRGLWVGGILIAVVIGVGVLALREPRFNGRTAAEWLEAMGPVPARNSDKLRHHEVRKNLESVRVEILPMIEREFRRAAFTKTSSREWFHKKTYFYVVLLGRFVPNRLGLSPPEVPKAELAQGMRLYWSTALLMDLSSDLVSGLARFESMADTVPPEVLPEASAGFRQLVDGNGALAAALVQRIQSNTNDPGRRALWISCLGELGPQGASLADLVRSWTRDRDAKVRREAIRALGTIDPRDDTVSFIQGCATDVDGRQGAILALMNMGARARPAEGFIRDRLNDSDMLTSLFAKWALDSLEKRTNAPATP